MDLDTLYKTYQPFLFSIAYRMLGSVTDAEDIVHDLFLQLKLDTDQIKELKAYLAKMTTNRCLNFLKSARKRREIYTGPWLPEPRVNQTEQPLDKVLSDETVSYAFLVLLDQLSPVERAVFVLREAFAYNYEDIAGMLEKTEVNCRKIYSRAKRKLQNDMLVPLENTEHVDLLAKTFIKASMTGNFEKFIDILTEDVVLVTDGGGKVISALNPIVNKQRVSAFLKGISAKGSFIGELLPVMVNGQKGILQVKEGHPIKVICFELDSKQKNIRRIFIVSNPDKLNHIPVS
ncbi:RNA polymerase sigma-70 factor [Bacillus pseudomycoides]|uniref:RNA polymerase sigma-70 factor n=1 Tax=Bacillus pseudomycoides TaxID=64104 RepID=UPI000BED6544|nr:RNA polymerase sigma-70 factor [Bacillus pseudomycoides]PEE37403.1 RNA polymerase sigma-70 factor [Bacillus pseudomycoides]PGA78722.1 RNA polymerase sigma-70 factor [Bacillus pseudomycoides]PHF31628.1 RNA polymerase sigma-70 factor [Bacillus pseudomycoides]